jgi:UDP-glucose 4-epimerase
VALVRRPFASGGGPFIALDLSKRKLLGSLSSVPDAIVHLAAAVPHGSGDADTEPLADCTRRIDSMVLEAAELWRSRLIYASGCSLYDAGDPRTKTETSAIAGHTPYLSAKLDGERAAAKLANTCIMRISAPVGPGIDPRAVIATFVERARTRQPIEVWGEGSREQDFIATSDVAEFVAAALERRATGVFNVASGQPISMAQLAKAVCDKIGTGEVCLGGRPDPLEGSTARFDIAAAESAFGWRPRIHLIDMIPEHGFELRIA